LPISDCQLPILVFAFELWPRILSGSEAHLFLEGQTPKTKGQIGDWQLEVGNGLADRINWRAIG